MILQSPTGDTFIVIAANVVRTISRYAGARTEAGGIFLGLHRSPHIEIVKCTEPMAGDVRSKFSFGRSDPGHQREATKEWEHSKRTITYVGEWHTHPQEIPLPSAIDRADWARTRKSRLLPSVFAIRGEKGWWFGLGIGSSEIFQLRELDPLLFDE